MTQKPGSGGNYTNYQSGLD